MGTENKYFEGCYVTEKRWLEYCKDGKRLRFRGLPVQIILPNDTVITPKEYWKLKEKKKSRWKPKEGEGHYFLSDGGSVLQVCWDNDEFDNYQYSIGNCFKNKQEAEEYKKKLIYQQQYKNYAEEHNDEIDWKANQLKHCACYNNEENKIKITHWESTKQQGVVHFTKQQDIWNFIKLIGEDNFKKYILEVEQ